MSHFLQRLASGVTRHSASASEPKLRPLLGSIYEPLGLHAATGSRASLASEEMESASRISQSGLRGESVEPHTPSLDPDDRQLSSPVVRSREQSHHEDGSQHETLLPPEKTRTQRMDSPQIPSAVKKDAARSADANAVPLRLDASFDEESAAPSETPARQDQLLPYVTAPDSVIAAQSRLSQTRTNARTAGKEAVRRGAQSTHEPDEIHIHIGRIEVAAVQQPVVRPAPAPARKAMSLDEYLKRSNGRAR